MRLEQLIYFVAVADHGSIRKAAEALYVSQPNLSRAIMNLEEEVQAKLLLRDNHGVTMTKVGESLYYYAKSITGHVDAITKLKDTAQSELIGYLKVAVACLFLRDDMMLQYVHHVLSDKKIINLTETNVEGVLNSVRSLESEIGIVIINNLQLQAFKKIIELHELECECLGESPLYAHVNQNSPLASKHSLLIEDLLPYDFLRIPQDFFTRMNELGNYDGHSLSEFKKVLYMNHYHSMINMINHTDAFMFGNKWQCEELLKCRIASIPVRNVDITYQFFIVKRKKEILSSEAQFFVDMIYKNYEYV